MKHTPGPWELLTLNRGKYGNVHSHVIFSQPYGEHNVRDGIAEVFVQRENYEENGRLLAAAPELLEALEDIAISIRSRSGTIQPSLTREILETAEKAIKKAKSL